ncbi:MAG: hypothetical protein AAFP22_01540 [Planctomycetota bacterium]
MPGVLLALTLAAAPAPLQQDGAPSVSIDLFNPAADDTTDVLAETTVGMRIVLKELVIPGGDLEPRPVADPGRADVIVRMLHRYPHGENRRYDLEVTPFTVGDFDLRDHLVRVGGGDLDDVDPLVVRAEAVTAIEDEVVEPVPIDVPHPSGVGGYKRLGIALGVLWVLGLLALVFGGRRRRDEDEGGATARPLTLAERLEPLVEGARAGTLDSESRAELERLVVAHWRREKGLSSASAADAITALRSDEDAAPLLLKLEEWLHRPGGSAASEDDVRALLEPFRSAPAESVR